MTRFVTRRLEGERLTEAHYADVHRMHRDPVQMELLGGVRSEAQTREYLARNLAHWARYGFGLWIVRHAASGVVAGRALVRHLELEGVDEIEIGYSLYPSYWGRGLGTEMAAECVRLAFEELHLASVVALTVPHNVRSRRVLERVGMTYERDVLHATIPHVLYRAERGLRRPLPASRPGPWRQHGKGRGGAGL